MQGNIIFSYNVVFGRYRFQITRCVKSMTTITENIIERRFISKTYKQLIKHNATIIILRNILENARDLYFEHANQLVISAR